MRLMLLALAVLAAGCYKTPEPACAFRCGPGGECPSGYMCQDDDQCHRIDQPGSCAPLASPDASLPMADATVDAPVPVPDAPLPPDAPEAEPDASLPDAAEVAPDAAVPDVPLVEPDAAEPDAAAPDAAAPMPDAAETPDALVFDARTDMT